MNKFLIDVVLPVVIYAGFTVFLIAAYLIGYEIYNLAFN